MLRWLTILGALAAIASLFAAACGSDEQKTTGQATGGATAGSISLEQDDFYFNPTELSGKVDRSFDVALSNQGNTTHSFTIDELNVSQDVKPGEKATVTVKPTKSGNLTFYCRFHATSKSMKGTLNVSDGAGAGASPTATKSSPSPTKSSGGGYGY